MKAPYLSIVIPARNEENRLPRSLGQVFAYLAAQAYTHEVIVVENGSQDRTLAVARKFTRNFAGLRVLHEDLPGKGRAVRRGILEADGDYRFIADVDFSMPVGEIGRFLPPACDCQVAIASREAPGSRRIDEPYYRHLSGRVFNFLIRLLVLPDLQDTQCGFKCFRGDIAEDIFSRQVMTGWSFDVEVLSIARRHGYAIQEIGVPWTYNSGSRVNVLRDAVRMTLDLLTIRRNLNRGVYDARA